MYAILDLESTGGKYNKEGITEIAIYKYDGQKVVDQFSCLVNPERKIQPFVVKLTGINNAMLRHAPKFHEVAKRVVEITKDCIIVAHNAKFDYRLLRTEFSRLGYSYSRETLCTVELSRKLIPGMPSYSLGKLVKKLGIPIVDRHRAIGDAQATVRLFDVLMNKDTEKSIIKESIRKQPKNNSGKALINIVESLPNKTGVYYMYNDKGKVIYVGKSRNIKKRVNQHFTAHHPEAKEIQKEVASVTYDTTGNELFALLKENAAIKRIKPKYNSALKKSIFQYGLYQSQDKQGYLRLKLGKTTQEKDFFLTFTNLTQGKKALQNMIERYKLCPKLVGLERKKGACFDYSIKKCRGACIAKEPPEKYNERVLDCINHFSFKNKNMLLIGPGRKPAEKGALLVEDGEFKGIAYYDLNRQVNNPEFIRNLLTPMKNDRDARHIIQNVMGKNNPFKVIEF